MAQRLELGEIQLRADLDSVFADSQGWVGWNRCREKHDMDPWREFVCVDHKHLAVGIDSRPHTGLVTKRRGKAKRVFETDDESRIVSEQLWALIALSLSNLRH